MPTQQQIEDEVLFWLGQQEKEHLYFMMLGVVEPAIRNEAVRLFQAYEEASQKRDVRTLLALAPASQALKQSAMQAASERWIGWLYPSLYQHMIQEIDFALLQTRRDLSPREIACFWAKERSDVGIVVAKLFDPVEAQLSAQAMRYHVQLRDLYAACRRPSMGNLSANVLQATSALNRMLEATDFLQIKNIIHPMLNQHEIREGQRAETTLRNAFLLPE